MVIMLVKVQRIRIFIAHQDRTEQKATYHYITLPYDITELNHRDCETNVPLQKNDCSYVPISHRLFLFGYQGFLYLGPKEDKSMAICVHI